MKHFINILVLSTLLPFSVICSAEPAKDPAMTSGMATETGKGAMDPAKLDEHLKDMQTHILQIHDLSNKILAETDPVKQQALKDQQLELLKAQHMKMMSRHGDKHRDHKSK